MARFTRRRFRKRRFSRKKGSHTWRHALKGVRKTLSITRPERKIEYTQIASAAVTTGGIITPLSNLETGDNSDQRIGRVVTHLNTNVRVLLSSTSATSANVVRIIMFRDKQTIVSVTPTVLQVLRIADPLAHRDTEISPHRFQIYSDRLHNMGVTTSSTARRIVKVNASSKHRVRYASAVSNQWTKNGMFILMIGDNGNTLVQSEIQKSFYDA